MSSARTPSLQARLSLVLTVLIAVLMSAGAAVWMRETRQAIHEEVEAATRVAQQWLVVVLAEQRDGDAEARARLLSRLAAVGRIRANRLEVFGAGGERLYVSPESPYKAGRDAPAWFAQPYNTSDTDAQSTLGLRSISALSGMAPRSSVRTPDSAPP